MTVPALVVVRVDAAGAPLSVRTNTGHGPCASDQWYVQAPDGRTRAASAALVGRVLAPRGSAAG